VITFSFIFGLMTPRRAVYTRKKRWGRWLNNTAAEDKSFDFHSQGLGDAWNSQYNSSLS
jgi:hypothetical protein